MTQSGYEIGRDLDGLTTREREVRDGIRQGKTLMKIGKELGVSRQRIGQIARSLKEKGAMK